MKSREKHLVIPAPASRETSSLRSKVRHIDWEKGERRKEGLEGGLGLESFGIVKHDEFGLGLPESP